MSILKKALCTALSVCTACSAAAFSKLESAQATDEYYVNEDFSGKTVDQLRASGWLDTFGTPSVEVTDSGDTAHGDALLLKGDSTAGFGTPIKKDGVCPTSGIYEMTMSVKPQANGNFFFDFYGGDGQSDGTYNSAVHFASNLGSPAVFFKRNTDTSQREFACTYTPGEWYDVRLLIDLDERYYYAEFIKDGVVLGSKNEIIMGATSGLENLRFRNWSGAGNNILVDNVCVKSYAGEMENMLMSDDFEKYTAVTGAALGKNAYDYGWTGAAHTSAAPELDSTTFASDEKYKTVVKSKYSSDTDNKSMQYVFHDAIAGKGKYRIKASVNPSDSISLLEVLPQGVGNGDTGLTALYWKPTSTTEGTFGILSPDITRPLSTYVMGKWYEVVITVDFDEQYYNIQILHDGSAIAQARHLPIAMCFLNNAMLPNFYAFQQVIWQGTTYTDNVSIEKLNGYETASDLAITNDNFDSYSTIEDAQPYGWNKHLTAPDKEVLFQQVGTKSGKSVKLTEETSGIEKIFTADPYLTPESGKYKITYSLLPNEGASIMVDAKVYDNTNSFNLAYVGGGGIYHTYPYANTSAKVCDYTPGEWVTIQNIVDLDALTNTYTVWNSSGQQIGSAEVHNLYNLMNVDATYDTLAAFRVCNWSSTVPAYLDDVSIEAYIPPVSVKSVNMYDAGNQLTSSDINSVSPATRKIVVDFGTTIEKSSLDGNVTITDASGNSVPFTGSISGNTYVMSLNEILSGSKKYDLNITSGVKNSNGAAMQNNYTLEFQTSAGYVSASLTGAAIDGTAVTSLSGLTKDKALSISGKYLNCTEDAKEYRVIVAYYKGNNLAAIDSAQSTMAGKTSSDAVTNTFTVKDLTNVTAVKIFLWDGLHDLFPYCEPIELK